MFKDGIVVDTTDGIAKVAVNRTSGCGGGCKTCGGCDTPQVFVELPNHLRAQIGDRVRLRANNSRVFFYSFIIYIVPIILLVSGIGFSYSYLFKKGIDQYEILSFLIGILTFGISAIILKVLDNKVAKKNSDLMVMDKITGNIVD